MRIQIACICKDEQDLIRPFIEHFLDLPQVEKLIIGDTGSTDASLDYIKSYDDPRIDLCEIGWNDDIAEARNKTIARLDKPEWVFFPDIDEIFTENYQAIFDKLDDMDLDEYDCIRFPFVKFWTFKELWFHKGPTLPYVDGDTIHYGMFKDTTALFKYELVKEGYKGVIHPSFVRDGVLDTPNYIIGSLRGQPVADINELQNDVFIGHYNKAKLHAQAERTGRSFEWCVGKKRVGFRRRRPFRYRSGNYYDKKWSETATDKDIEQLGLDQLDQFINVEGHTFRPDYDASELNNEFVRKHFK